MRRVRCMRCSPDNCASLAGIRTPTPRRTRLSSWRILLSSIVKTNQMIISRRRFLERTAMLASSALACSNGWAAPAGRPNRMMNGAPASGLDFVLRNDAQGHKYQVETLPGGLGVIDFDGDGWPDIYCVNGAELPGLKKTDKSYYNQLYRNNREGGFIDVTERAGLQGHGYEMGAAVGDYNNDSLE